MNFILGLIAGLAASLYFIYLFPAKQFSVKIAKSAKTSLGWPLAEPNAIEPLSDEDLIWPQAQPEIEPALAYGPVETEKESLGAEQNVEHDIEEPEDEFEPYFRGNINNVIQR